MGNLQAAMTKSYKRKEHSHYKRRTPQRKTVHKRKTPPIAPKKPLTFKRSEVIDEEKEAKLLSTVIGLALESNKFENGWNIHAENRSLQTKPDPVSKRPIARSITRNESCTTFKQMYDYFEMGDNKERGGHIVYHIDDDHDIEYVIDEESDADSQYMCVRHTTSITDQSQLSYKVAVRLIYDVPESHPVFMPPPDECTRAEVKCEARVCFSRESAQETDFTLVYVAFTPDSGGLLSKSKENLAASNLAVKNMNIFQKKCEEIPRILKRRKSN